MWESSTRTSLSLFDEANLCFSLLKLLTANHVGVVMHPVESPLGSYRFSGNLVGL